MVGCGFVEDGQSERGGRWLWVCGGGAVGLGLWRWGYGFVEVVSVGLWVCRGGAVCFEEKSRRNREMKGREK